jgi:hypothetical protein
MEIEHKYVSPYENRIQLVTGALVDHSQLDGETATELAAHVLRAIDHIPEKIR